MPKTPSETDSFKDCLIVEIGLQLSAKKKTVSLGGLYKAINKKLRVSLLYRFLVLKHKFFKNVLKN